MGKWRFQEGRPLLPLLDPHTHPQQPPAEPTPRAICRREAAPGPPKPQG